MSRSPGLKVVESFMPRLSNRQFPLLRYRVFTLIATRRRCDPGTYRVSINRDRQMELFGSVVFGRDLVSAYRGL